VRQQVATITAERDTARAETQTARAEFGVLASQVAAFSAFLTEHADHELWRGDAVALELNSRDFTQRATTMSRNAKALAREL
jgi:cystathionine beta-lyase/cystathionine gamma-synthase